MYIERQRVNKLGQRGATLSEVLIGIVIVSIMVGVVAKFSSSYTSRPMTMQRACEQYAQSIVQTVQQETFYQHISNFVPASPVARTASAFVDNNPTIAVPAGQVNTVWWGGGAGPYVISQATGPATSGVTLQNFQLIKGNIRTLAGIYNANAGLRCNFSTYAPLTTVAYSAEFSGVGAAPSAQIQIRPYRRDTGANYCPGGGLYIAPTPANPTNPLSSAIAANSGSQNGEIEAANSPPAPLAGHRIANRGVGKPNIDTDFDVGIELTALVSYTQDGAAKSCRVTQKFEYPVDRTAPPAPTVSVTANATSARANCGAVMSRNATIRIDGGGSFERGSQFVCHDLSWQMSWVSSGAGYIPCRPIGFASINTSQPNPTSENFASRQTRWMPCDQLTQCGVAPTVTYPNANPNIAAVQSLDLTFNGLPQGCVLNLEAVTVDTAGNSSATARSFLEDAAVGIAANNVMYEKTCGTPASSVAWPAPYASADTTPNARGILCTSPPLGDPSRWNAGDLAAYPNGYYTCRAGGNGPCCVNALGSSSCTPNN